MALSASCLVVYVKKQQPARKEEVEIRNWLTSIYTGGREREREHPPPQHPTDLLQHSYIVSK